MTEEQLGMESYLISGADRSIYPKVSVGKLCLDRLKKHDPNKVAIVDAVTNETITNQQLINRSIKMAIGLQKLGIGKDDMVTIISENNINYSTPILSCYYIGAIINLINNTYKETELLNALKKCKPKLMICSETSLKLVEIMRCHIDSVKIVSFGNGSSGVYGFEDVLKMGEGEIEEFTPIDVNVEEQLSIVLSSSGTTGLPKSAMHTHENNILIMHLSTNERFLNMTNADCALGVLPFYHGLGLFVNLGSIVNGTKLVVCNKFDPVAFLNAIQKHRITKLYLVPTLAVFLAKSPLVDKYDLSSVNDIICGAACLGPEIQQVLSKKMNAHVRQLYGSTETGIPIITRKESTAYLKPGCSGSISDNVLVKVVDAKTRRPLGPNELGEICIKSRMNMKSYMHDEQETRDAFDEDGFLKTGDIGYYDEDKNFFIVDRLKELIKYKGFQVSPAEIEDLLASHQCIKEAGVVGFPDERCGELPLAFIVKQEGCEVSEEDIIKYVAENLSVPKQLHGGVRFVKELPKNQAGKVMRRILREMID